MWRAVKLGFGWAGTGLFPAQASSLGSRRDGALCPGPTGPSMCKVCGSALAEHPLFLLLIRALTCSHPNPHILTEEKACDFLVKFKLFFSLCALASLIQSVLLLLCKHQFEVSTAAARLFHRNFCLRLKESLSQADFPGVGHVFFVSVWVVLSPGLVRKSLTSSSPGPRSGLCR